MLSERIDLEHLSDCLVSREAWRPCPGIADREDWGALPDAVRARLVDKGEKALALPWSALPATLFLDFARTGNRSRYEKSYFERTGMLQSLVLAECAEGEGRFLDAIADGAWLLCEQSTWCLPAHTYMNDTGVGLADIGAPVVDLFAGETAALLAWTRYLLGERLDTVSAQIGRRVEREIASRILAPCLDRDDFWWMGFRGGRVNNWNPWVNSNWLACNLLLERDPVRRARAVAKAIRSLDVFVDGYPSDGGCDEGPGYWGRAGASLFDCLELLHSATQGAIDLFREPLIGEIGRFIVRAQIHGEWFVNFADAPAVVAPSAFLVYRYGQRVGDADMQAFGAHLAQRAPDAAACRGGCLMRTLPALFLAESIARQPGREPLPRDVWLPETEVFVARSVSGSGDGLTLAAKGGHNAESHNHNDVGHFVVYADGRPVLVDVGVEAYTAKTFSPDRYSIWTMQSSFHNLPTVNGVMQSPGREFAASDVEYKADDRAASLSLSLAKAYPLEAGIRSWRRSLALERGGAVTVTDTYELAEASSDVCLSLMTPCDVRVHAGVIELAGVELPKGRRSGDARVIFDAERLQVSCEPIDVADGALRGIWGDRVCRIRLSAPRAARGEWTLRILPVSRGDGEEAR